MTSEVKDDLKIELSDLNYLCSHQAPDGYSQQQTLLIFGLGFDFFFSTDFVGCFPITYQNWLLQSGPEVAQTSQHVNMIGQVCNGSISV